MAFPGTVLLVSHDRALLDAVAQRTLAIEDGSLTSYEGGWAELIRRREEREKAAEPSPKPKAPKRKPAPAKPTGPTPLEAVETEIATKEETVAELERRLADDWGNVELLAAHRKARTELQDLLARWEQLFQRSGA
jgi:ATP-binding cassette subfamily F protein 3